MIPEDKQLIESLIADSEISRDASDWGAAKMGYLKALDEFKRIEEGSADGEYLAPEDRLIKQKILEAIAVVDVKLAGMHRDQGISAFESKDYARAIDELEEAINLGSEKDLPFLEEVKKYLDKARVKDTDQKIYEEITPFVSRGDEFRKSGNYGEAILEYQEALKALAGIPPQHRFPQYVHLCLKECRRNLVRPYLTSIYRAASEGKHVKAFKILQRVLFLVDEADLIYRAFLEQIKTDLLTHISSQEVEEDAPDAEQWSDAIADYEEALNLYSSFSGSDPFGPAYTSGNAYEERFLKTRRNLGALYKKRAEKLRDNAQVHKALKNFKEALKLFPKSDKEFHDTFKEMKRLRAQLTHKEA